MPSRLSFCFITDIQYSTKYRCIPKSSTAYEKKSNWNFTKKSAKTRSLETKVIDENIPKISLSPIAEAPLQYNPQKSFSRNRHQVFQSVYLCSPRNSISSGKKEQENFLGESDEYLWNKKVFCVHFLYACMRAWVSSLLGRPSDYKFMG